MPSHVLTVYQNITLFTIDRTGKKQCYISEQIIGIVMASERDFDKVYCVWSCNLYEL